MAPLQKRAWWGLVIGLALGIALLLVFFLGGGIDKFNKDPDFRIVIDALAVAALVVNLVIFSILMKKPGMTDERDTKILTWAPFVQWLAVIFVLAAWTIGLTVYYNATDQMPVEFLFIIMLSVLVISTVAQSLGILVGYWRMNR